MLHRRPGSLASSSNNRLPPQINTQAAPPTNTAYTPLKRRESANLYATPPGQVQGHGQGPQYQSAPKARYTMPPSPSPTHLGLPGAGFGGASSYGNAPPYSGSGGGGVYDLAEGARRTPIERVLGDVRRALTGVGRGLEDASRLDRSWSLVWGDPELRLLVLKSSMINLLSLLLLSFAEVVFSPLLQSSPSAIHRSHEIGLWYNVLFSWPVFVSCFWINAIWGPEISRRATTLLHPTYRHQPPSSPRRTSDSPSYTQPSRTLEPSYVLARIVASIKRILLIGDFHLVGAVIAFVPLVGRWLSFAYMCIITSHYCFEWSSSSKGWSLDRRISFIQERTAYMLGFGFLATLVTSFGTSLVNMAIFALIYPFFVIQALLARPPYPAKDSMIPNTPSPAASVPPSPSDGGPGLGLGLSLQNPFFASAGSVNTAPVSLEHGQWHFRVPLFFMARYAMAALDWFVAAILRDRVRGVGFGRDRGKRAF